MSILGRGAGFAVRPGLWRRALAAACECRRRPLQWGPLRTTWSATEHGRLCVRVAEGARGSDPAVVLVHGVIVSSRYMLPTAAELAADVDVLVPDLPGYGLSEAPPGPLTLATLADAAVACATAAGHDRVALVGNSFGAQIAVEAAVRHPARVARLALIGPTTDPVARTLPRQYLRWQRNAPDEHLAIVPVMARDLADMGLRRAAALLRVMLDDPIEAKLPHVQAPTLVVRGDRDRLVPQRWADEVVGLLPHGELATVPAYAHMPQWSGPLALAPMLRAFLLGGDLSWAARRR